MTLRWAQDDLEQYLRKFAAPDRSAVPITYVESNSRHAAKPADAGEKVDQKFRIHIHSRRRRACDPDGLYAKSAIDGLTEGGILPDDNSTIVSAVSYSQEKSKLEQTVIEIWEKGQL